MMKGLDDESAKGAAYRYFDLCDREFIECRVRLRNRIILSLFINLFA